MYVNVARLTALIWHFHDNVKTVICLSVRLYRLVFHESQYKFFLPLLMRYKGQPWPYSMSIIPTLILHLTQNYVIIITISAHWPAKVVSVIGFIAQLPLWVSMEKLLDLTRMIRATLQPKLPVCMCAYDVCMHVCGVDGQWNIFKGLKI